MTLIDLKIKKWEELLKIWQEALKSFSGNSVKTELAEIKLNEIKEILSDLKDLKKHY